MMVGKGVGRSQSAAGRGGTEASQPIHASTSGRLRIEEGRRQRGEQPGAGSYRSMAEQQRVRPRPLA